MKLGKHLKQTGLDITFASLRTSIVKTKVDYNLYGYAIKRTWDVVRPQTLFNITL